MSRVASFKLVGLRENTIVTPPRAPSRRVYSPSSSERLDKEPVAFIFCVRAWRLPPATSFASRYSSGVGRRPKIAATAASSALARYTFAPLPKRFGKLRVDVDTTDSTAEDVCFTLFRYREVPGLDCVVWNRVHQVPKRYPGLHSPFKPYKDGLRHVQRNDPSRGSKCDEPAPRRKRNTDRKPRVRVPARAHGVRQ
eukprot:12669-Pelagococcus_subviridis.AAC.1